jgi:chemotaxis protein methyltransferase CheR
MIEITDNDIDGILDDLIEIHGYNFTNYSRASVRRRINLLLVKDHFEKISDLRQRLRRDKDYLPGFVEKVTVNVTEMFRDPSFFKAIQQFVIPELAIYPFIRIWLAGCASGEEAYSLAILLKESGLLGKSLLYATDINPAILEQVRSGVYGYQDLEQYGRNYLSAGGSGQLMDHYKRDGNNVQFDRSLSEKMVISVHNLVSDSSFNEFQMILCRNVMIYFNRSLQDKVFNLFDQSLMPAGFFALGSRETLKFSTLALNYKQLPQKEKIWRKTL